MDVVAGVAVLLGAVAQALTGFGFSLVSAPFLVAAYDAPDGVQLNVAISVLVNIVLLAGARAHVQWATAGRLLAPAAVATVVVGLLLHDADGGAVTVVAGALCLVGVVAVARNRPVARLRGAPATVTIGALSGAMNVAAGIGGPPVVLFGLNAGWEPRTARATLQAFFLGINIVALATLGFPERVPPLVVGGMVVGLGVGWALTKRTSVDHVRGATLVIAAGGSILAIARGIAG
jgi:uncharacterized membrane protein YfcA